MVPILTLHANHGPPLCVSGITPRFSLSIEMADHDRRRKAIKKQRSEARENFHADQGIGVQQHHVRVLEEIREGEIDGDLASVIHDLLLFHPCLACTAKAA
ncbi:hypothetical protein RJ641_008541 [Dillenia turbinata]|uniref:Uncharacterized protein n=1 Tax=Dillenia turbinata TaxID=194707 RepID=A0AAN8Z6L3_9MAGN